MKRLEILAPVGGMESLEPAVRCGADAVYLGASRFSARKGAQNFDEEQLCHAVAYCHARGVKVYLALNTLLSDEELPEALTWAELACNLGIDAVILQDLGLSRLLAKAAPQLKRSASTQMSIHTPQGAQLCAALGFGRVVLARECSAQEMHQIATAAPLEMEAFAHGALCMSVSGQCWLSAVLGSRSGNRGQCAQPCRLPFAAENGTGYDLSLKDLSLVGRLKELEEAGVVSAKIEGRMKRPEYVAAAVSACRKEADGKEAEPWLLSDLQAVFSRSGFTSGYFDNARGKEMFGIRRKEDVQAAPAAIRRLHELYRGERQSVPISLQFTAQAGKACELILRDDCGNAVCQTGGIPQPAKTQPLTEELCAKQLQKFGATPFYVKEWNCNVQEGLMLSASELNALRRRAAEQLLQLRQQPKPVFFDRALCQKMIEEQTTQIPRFVSGENAPYRLHFASVEQIPQGGRAFEAVRQAQCVYLRADTPAEELKKLIARGVSVGVELPRALFHVTETFRTYLRAAKELGISHVWAGTLNAVALAKEEDMTVHGGFGLNVFNTQSLCALNEMGLADTELSFELTARQAQLLSGSLPRGVLVYGHLPLMLTRCCPLKNAHSCEHCDKKGTLTDRKGFSFPVRCFGAASELLNRVPLFQLDRLREVKNVDFVSLRFTVENSVEIGEILTQFPHNVRPSFDFTRGLAEKGVL